MKRGRPTKAIRAAREDYAAVLVEAGIDQQWVQSVTTNTADLCPMPEPCYWIMVKPSAIHGQGLFSFLAIGVPVKAIKHALGSTSRIRACRLSRLPYWLR